MQAFTDLTKHSVLPIQAVQILPSGYVKLASIRPFCTTCTTTPVLAAAMAMNASVISTTFQ